MSGLGYLFAAYLTIWVLLFGYMFSIAKRQKALEKEIKQLQDMKEGTV